MFFDIIDQINNMLWELSSILLLVGTGLFLTIVLKGLLFRKLSEAFKPVFTKDEEDTKSGQSDVSNFKALITSLAGMIGNGNIAGVAPWWSGSDFLDVDRRISRYGAVTLSCRQSRNGGLLSYVLAYAR